MRDEPLEIIEYKDYTIKIYPDDSPTDPREWDNLGTMVCFYRRHSLGDKHNFRDAEHLKEYLIENQCTWLPLYLYDHSGITMNTRGFNCPWDSGQVGVIFVTREKACKEYGWNRLTKQRQKQLVGYLEGEVNTYDQYLRGDVHGYELYRGDEFIDSCWGFFDETEDTITDVKAIADRDEAQRYPLLDYINQQTKQETNQ